MNQEDRMNDTIELEKQLSKDVWPEEAKAIPQDELTTEEKKLIEKCIAKEDFDEDEFKDLKKVLQRYRPYIAKHNPQEAIEQVDNVKNMIRTEQELLDILDQKNMDLTVRLPVDGKFYEMEFKILPIEDSRIVEALEFQVSMFQDFSKTEQRVYQKAQQNQPLTREEKSVLEKINKEINEKAGTEANRVCNQLLASQLRLPDSTMNKEKREEFWAKFPFNPKFQIFYKVQEKLGLTEANAEELFPTGE